LVLLEVTDMELVTVGELVALAATDLEAVEVEVMEGVGVPV
jgi:hypothetical protein